MEEWYSVSDAGKKLHVDRTTVYRWIREHKIAGRYIRQFPNGQIAINARGLIRPRSKKHRLPDRTMPPGDEVESDIT